MLVGEEWGLPYSQLLEAMLPCLSDDEEEVQQATKEACHDLMENVVTVSHCHV